MNRPAIARMSIPRDEVIIIGVEYAEPDEIPKPVFTPPPSWSLLKSAVMLVCNHAFCKFSHRGEDGPDGSLLMLVVVIFKALNLLSVAGDKSYIKRTGSAHGVNPLCVIELIFTSNTITLNAI
ncbi:hypothetical protein KSP40_PGU012195 [Platanthera guangdongensis]|uniref:Uncharacterized protein n=1 Tax=Platanthera guangdongensis TaxID=2320717 RepID=A0ABR2MNY0_9ASPA